MEAGEETLRNRTCCYCHAAVTHGEGNEDQLPVCKDCAPGFKLLPSGQVIEKPGLPTEHVSRPPAVLVGQQTLDTELPPRRRPARGPRGRSAQDGAPRGGDHVAAGGKFPPMPLQARPRRSGDLPPGSTASHAELERSWRARRGRHWPHEPVPQVPGALLDGGVVH